MEKRPPLMSALNAMQNAQPAIKPRRTAALALKVDQIQPTCTGPFLMLITMNALILA